MSPRPTFREYIRSRRVCRTPTGDFTRDAQIDPELPNVGTRAELTLYLMRRGACHAAIEAGKAVWDAYRRHLRQLEAGR